MEIVWFLLIGLIAGWIADMLVKGVGFGIVGDMIVGCVGALIGGYLFGVLGIATYGLLGSIIAAVVGAVIFLWILKAVSRKR
jgi:uncharacterized membrane protein YeaQ/YmgE (transglycosylase-associated protein family)